MAKNVVTMMMNSFMLDIRFFWNYDQRPAVLAPQNINFNQLPDGPFRKEAVKVVYALNIGAINGHNQIPHLKTGTPGRTPELDGNNFSGIILVQTVKANATPVKRSLARRDTQKRTAHPAVGKDLRNNPLGRVRRDRKTDSLGKCDNRRIDSHDLSSRIDQGTAGVAGIERCGVLDDIFNQPAPGASQGPSESADHPGGHR
jgi:hypothetical protein